MTDIEMLERLQVLLTAAQKCLAVLDDGECNCEPEIDYICGLCSLKGAIAEAEEAK